MIELHVSDFATVAVLVEVGSLLQAETCQSPIYICYLLPFWLKVYVRGNIFCRFSPITFEGFLVELEAGGLVVSPV